MIKALIFDWGDTIMRDFPENKGPMALWEKVEWIPFAEKALKDLHQKYFCCIASNAGCSDTYLMREALKRINAEKYFQHFYTSKDIGFEKPDTRFFQYIADLIKFLPQECVMIGNSYDKDIIGAKIIGMKTIFFNENRQSGEFPFADKIIFSMNDLVNAINEIAD